MNAQFFCELYIKNAITSPASLAQTDIDNLSKLLSILFFYPTVLVIEFIPVYLTCSILICPARTCWAYALLI